MPTRVTARAPDPTRMRIEVRTDAGHPVLLDTGPPDGEGSAAGPKEALLAALAGCTGMDVLALLRRKRQHAVGYEIVVEGDSAERHPKVFTAIRVEHRVRGDVEPEALRRSIELSATQYCPVNAMLSQVATIEHRYVLERDGHEPAGSVAATVGPQASPVADDPRGPGAAGA